MSLRVVAATKAQAPGLLALFEAASYGCYCRWWHFDGEDLAWQGRCNLEPQDNRDEFDRALAQGDHSARGMVALEDDRVVGWLKLAPADTMTKLYGRRVYRTLDCFGGDRSGVAVIGCLVVHPDARRRGVAAALIAGAVDQARGEGLRALEAMPRRAQESVRDDELWMGPPTVFDRLGFVRVDDGPDPYPVLRLEL